MPQSDRGLWEVDMQGGREREEGRGWVGWWVNGGHKVLQLVERDPLALSLSLSYILVSHSVVHCSSL